MSDNARGALAMALAMLAFTANDAMMKLSFEGAPIGQSIVVRGVFGLAIGVAIAYAAGALKVWREMGRRVVLFRSALDAVAAALFLTALAEVPLVTLFATLQATPLIATAFAAIALGEAVGWRRWAATLVGLVGVLIVIDPFGAEGETSAYAFLGLAAAFFAAGRDVATRGVPAATPTLLIALASVASITAMGGAMSIARGDPWATLDLAAIGLFAAAAIGIFAGNYFVGQAMRVGDVSAVSPVRYTLVIWAMLFGWLLFSETPTTQDLVGVAIVVAAGLYTLRREKIRRQSVTTKAGMRGAP